jgi:Holliday junction resolvase RusA-like endonuclease
MRKNKFNIRNIPVAKKIGFTRAPKSEKTAANVSVSEKKVVKKRVQQSYGQCKHNEYYQGIRCSVLDIKEEKYVLDFTREFYLFDVVPVGAVRMTKSDTWKTDPNHPDPLKRQRAPVTKYFAFKTMLKTQAIQMGFELGNHLDAVYLIPMPDSWSEKKKKAMNAMPCKSKPDCDNITKAIKDTLLKEDSAVWHEKAQKYWAYTGSIIIFK